MYVIFKQISIFDILTISWIQTTSSPQFNATGLHHEVNIGFGDGLVLSGNMPSPDPMFTKIYDGI